MKAETIKHTDVRGNELLYLKLTDENTNNEVLINIGQKTFDAVNNLPKQALEPKTGEIYPNNQKTKKK